MRPFGSWKPDLGGHQRVRQLLSVSSLPSLLCCVALALCLSFVFLSEGRIPLFTYGFTALLNPLQLVCRWLGLL